MNTYLLLRDNKESGPYSSDDLRNLGLKAYDLVWIKGKSAAWRYPSEVEELKDFAPVVEEQPFDRFYKKNTDEQKDEIKNDKTESLSPSSPVFVSMPEQKVKIANPPATSSPASKTITIKENPVVAEIKYSKPLDEIKEMYVKTLQQRKQKIARKKFVFKNLRRASVFFYMLALGVLIGFTIKSRYPTKPKTSSRQIENAQTAVTNPATNTSQIIQQPQQELSEVKTETRDVTNNEPAHKPVSFKSQQTITKKKEIVSNIPNQSTPTLQTNAITGDRNKKNRNEVENINAVSKEDISKLVSVKSNDYKRGAFGGIRDLQLTVTNDSKYILDNVTVQLQYLKPSEQPLISENVQFKAISPNGSLTISIPATNRGIKVAYKIIKIESKELNGETAGM